MYSRERVAVLGVMPSGSCDMGSNVMVVLVCLFLTTIWVYHFNGHKYQSSIPVIYRFHTRSIMEDIVKQSGFTYSSPNSLRQKSNSVRVRISIYSKVKRACMNVAFAVLPYPKLHHHIPTPSSFVTGVFNFIYWKNQLTRVRPTSKGAMSSKITGETSMSPLEQPGHKSTTRAAVWRPFPWMVIHLPQLAPLA